MSLPPVKARIVKGRRFEHWRDPVARTGLCHRVKLDCGHTALVDVAKRSGLVECPACTDASHREAARRELKAHPDIVRMRCRQSAAYAAERERLLALERKHQLEQASGRPGAGVD
jgi:hypothetical protein